MGFRCRTGNHGVRHDTAPAALSLAADEGEAGPPGTSCVRGKMAAPGPCSQELKMEDAAARPSGAGESPTQRKKALPLAGRCFL